MKKDEKILFYLFHELGIDLKKSECYYNQQVFKNDLNT